MKFDLDPASCLGATEFFEIEHPAVSACVAALDADGAAPNEQAVKAFEFVRDRITYEFRAKLTREEYHASYILRVGKGFCTQKATLLCALGRAMGIPSALVMTDLRDHTFPDHVLEALGTDTLAYHGIAAFHLDGRWLCADATLSPELCARRGYRLSQFDGRENGLLPAETLAGAPHVEYVRWRGIYADLPFEEMLASFREFEHLIGHEGAPRLRL